MEEHKSQKLHGSTKGFLAIVVIIAILVPIFLGIVLVKGLPYSLPTPAAASTTTTAASASNVIVLPQGAGGAEKLNFSPSTLTVASGTTVIFEDQDSVPHNVYFTSVPSGAANPNGTNPPILMMGSNYNVTLTTPGTYTFECQFHSGWMQGTITVSS